VNKGIIAILGAFYIFGVGNIACSDADIVHPILCYEPVRTCTGCPPDSILVGKITFYPLPEYQKPSKMLIEWYCRGEITKNVTFRVEGPVWNYQLSRPLPVWPAPIHKGDTVRGEITITPLTVGIVELRMGGVIPAMLNTGDSSVLRESHVVSLWTAFVLGPNGQTTAMNSPATNEPYATFLGPLPEVMAESLLFFRYPKFPADLAGPNTSNSPIHQRFAIEGIVYTQPDDSGYRKITCRVSPYFQFDAGIGFQVNRSEDVVIKDVSPSVVHPVSPRDTIEFSLWYRVTQWGISRMSLHFRTFNPDYGKSEGPIGDPDQEDIGTHLPIYFGYDRDMTLVFITDESPSDNKGSYDRTNQWNDSKRWLMQQQMDPRVAWIGGLPAIRKEWKSYDSEGFDKVMNFGRKPVEFVPPKHGR
jgi:hypothetical protein